MTRRIIVTICLAATSVGLAGVVLAGAAMSQSQPAAAAAALTAEQIVAKANYTAYYQGKDGRAKVKMTVIDKQGRQRGKELVVLRMDVDDLKADQAETEQFKKADKASQGDQKFYVYFLHPPDDKKTTFLVWKHPGSDDDRWLYLPNLDLVKRIAATDKRTSFVGSHFLYEDISGRSINDDTHALHQTTGDYYIIRNTPKNPKSVEFAYYDMYVLRDSFVPVYVMYYDAGGAKYRTYSVLKWQRDEKYGYAKVVKAKMEDTRMGGHTILEYKDIKYNIALPDSLFTERFLKRTPYRYLK